MSVDGLEELGLECVAYHPAAFERVVDSIKGVSTHGFFDVAMLMRVPMDLSFYRTWI